MKPSTYRSLLDPDPRAGDLYLYFRGVSGLGRCGHRHEEGSRSWCPACGLVRQADPPLFGANHVEHKGRPDRPRRLTNRQLKAARDNGPRSKTSTGKVFQGSRRGNLRGIVQLQMIKAALRSEP